MRRDAERVRRSRAALSYTGLILVVCGLVVLTPLSALAFYPEERGWAPSFLFPAVVLVGGGGALYRVLRVEPSPPLALKDGAISVVLAWVVAIVVSSYPFLVLLDDFTLAVFESMSGWTTTGLSVLDLESAPRILLLWRSIMQLAGGAGVAVIFIAALGGPLGPGLALAEGRSDQLVPHVRHSLALVVRIYAGYAIFGVLALRAAGMSPFDAVNHCFAAVSTGGFSTRVESIGYWDSIAVEGVTLLLMVCGSTSFLTMYLLLNGKAFAALRTAEVKTFSTVIAVAIPLLFLGCTQALYDSERSVRVAIFEIVSAATTTGFSTTTYSGWPPLATFLLLPIMIVGGGSGSTAGGLKQFRAYILLRSLFWELRKLALPRSAVQERAVFRGRHREFVEDRALVQVGAFVTGYVALYVAGSAILVASGFGVAESLFEYASALGTVGLSVGVTSASAPAVVLWTEMIGMLLGRLEIFVVLLALRQGLDIGRTLRG